jgi:uncharacterized membrane protein
VTGLSRDRGTDRSRAEAASSTGLGTTVASSLAYLGWWVTGLIFWFLERRDPVVRFHAAQSIVVFGTVALGVAALTVLALASLSFVPRAFGPLLLAALGLALLGVGLWALALWRVAGGHSWQLPVASRVARWLARM